MPHVRKNFLLFLLSSLILALLMTAGWTFLSKEQPVHQTQQNHPAGSTTTSPSLDDSTASWKTYHNENYGIIFKYPDSLNITESYSIDRGGELLQTDLISKNQQNENNIGVEPKISISSICLIPENVPKESWENNFQQSLAFVDLPIEDKLQEFVKTYELGARKLFVFKRGCYECYDGWDQEMQTFIPNPNKEYDGFSAYSCEAGLNRNGNKAARCLTIVTEQQKIGSLELKELQNFFLDDFLPRLELHRGLINVRDCDGLGESVGKIPLPSKKT